MLQLNDQQQAAAQADRSAAVISSAGTGKTAMLTQRYLNHVLGGLSPLQVVAVTFTEAAAHELRGRVRAALRHSPLTTPAALAELELSPIGTIHSLCARICREHPEEAEVPASFQILDQAAAAIFAAEQREGLLASLPHDLFLGEAGIPLGQAERILPHLLEAPHLTAEALAVMAQPWNELREAWEAAAATLRTAAQARLCNSEWHDSAAFLRGLTCSDAGDALYSQWQTIVAQLEAIEQAADPGEAVAALAEARLSGGGKAANWSAPPAEVRAACKFLRDAAVTTLKDGLITLRIGPDDEQLYAKAATLRSIFERASATMAGIKRRAGVLDFADLELGALRALEHEGVREWYRQRWQVLLLDEAQDINRTQAVILERLATLAPDNLVCAVGDEKQAIYGFRGADVEEFRRFRDEVVVGRLGGQVIDLDQTYRQHRPLAASFNTMFGPLLGRLHREVIAQRPAPHVHARFVEYLCLEGVAGGKSACRRAEGSHLAQRLRSWLDEQLLVHDRRSGGLRPLQPGDVAFLSRAWEPLDSYAEALAAAGIPAIHAGGGSLLATREAKDGLAMLRLLAQPRGDRLALAAVLRGPWFGLSDRVLLDLAEAAVEGNWWAALGELPETAEAAAVLAALEQAAGLELPSHLLQLADHLTGYSAVLARLPMAARRLADWRGFLDLVRGYERGGADPWVVGRRLKQALELGLALPRPVLEAGNAVSLMTIHGAKGLEFPVVIVPDLDRGSPPSGDAVLLDRLQGVGFEFTRPDGGQASPFLWRSLRQQQQQHELAERRRLLYVACTRAQDRLVLSVAGADRDARNTLHELLKPSWEALGVELEALATTANEASPPALPTPPPPPPPPAGALLVEPLGPCLASLPITALDDYANCPKHFEFGHLYGNPGLGPTISERPGYATRIGDLVHRALQEGLRGVAELARLDPLLPQDRLAEAARLVEGFHETLEFAPFRNAIARELPVRWTVGSGLGIELRGTADLVGDDWVLDYKTGRHTSKERHRFQLWAYAQALGVSQAYVADLRAARLLHYPAEELATAGQEAAALLAEMQAGRFEPRPDVQRCQACEYRQLCPAATPAEPAPTAI